MGFSNQLQSRETHEAVLSRQDAELRLLELMKRCIVSKMKCDKDYALALTAVASQGWKLERSDEFGSSLVAKSWKGMLDEIESIAKLIKNNAEAIEKDTLEKLNNLCQEKRKARKHYLEDHARITQQFSNLCEEVARKKADYQKQLEFYRLTRSRFEEHYVKSGRVGRKLDDVRDKYQRACRKLHLVHNEYVLLLAEAEQAQKDLNSSLVPTLYQHHQATLQSFITNWKSILKELASQWNFSSNNFLEIYSKLEAYPDSIVPSEEYSDFTNKQNGVKLEPVDFTFDPNLVEDTSGRLLANTLAVDNLTVEWVRGKVSETEPRLKDVQEKLSNKNSNLQQLTEVELAELKSEEKRLSKQLEVVKKALNEIGCEEIPPGCDMPNILENHLEAQSQDGNHTDHLLPGGKRASVVSSPGSPQSASSSLPHINLTLSAPPPPAPPATQSFVDMLKKPFRRKSVPNSPLGSPRLNNSNSSRSLYEEEWFHGVLPREEVVRLLTKDGDFLVRETTRNDENQTVLSVCWTGHKHFIVQTTAEGQFRFEGPAFPTIQELIMYQYQSGLPVTGRSGAILRQPIPRERWELNNDDVILQEKIGRGNFGDVYKGRLRGSDEEVAVKTCRMTVADENKRRFLQEGRILKQYDHPNVVKLIGICVQKQPIMIVMELVHGGSLLTFLRNNASSLNTKQMLRMCRDAAAGMSYLESKNCIHRDLAARNCLVGDNNTVKISDFGMSREEEEYIVSDGMKQIPIKWTAPEALNFGKYTSLCDVWSYGVLCWEIFSKGETPYPGLSNSKAREKIDSGYRLPAPEGTPEEMYRLMLRCWEYKPEKRPHFDQILAMVEKQISSHVHPLVHLLSSR